jgi:hypothetical protein
MIVCKPSNIKECRKKQKERCLGDPGVLVFAKSLDDSARGALVDASTAVAALGCIDNCDVIAGDGGLRANVDACSACDTIGLFDRNHFDSSAIIDRQIDT